MGLFSKKSRDIDPETEISVISSGNINEVTQKKEQQSQISELALQYIPEGVIIIDGNLNIRLTNPASENMIGKSRMEIVGIRYDSCLKLLDRDNNPVTESNDPILYVFNSGQMGETRDYQIKTNGSERITPVSIIITPTNGPKSSLVITIRDITKQLKEEGEKNDFISTASHEMRTPVASIEGYLGLALNPATATIDARAKSYLEKAHESSQHLGKLFRDLLDTTKLDDRKTKLHNAPCELNQLAKSIADGQAPNIQAKNLQYRFNGNAANAQSSVHRIGQLVYVNVDIDFMREIIDNLIENAIKYTKQGFINVSVTGDSSNAIISVQDTGIGMPKDELSHIFQKFYRIDNSDTREIGGTGLGLYLVKQRVEQMQGRIWVESELGKGSIFYVSLPRIDEETYTQMKFVYDNVQRQQQNKLLEN